MKKLFLAIIPMVLLAACGGNQNKKTVTISAEDIVESYAYLFGRDLILRQQQLDFEEGFQWNQLVHREPGQVQ